MILPLLFGIILSKSKICICSTNCSSLYQGIFYNATSNSIFKDFMIPFIKKDKEIELNFYSEDEKFIFKLDLSDFEDNKLFLKNIINSRPINVIIQNEKSFIENISIKPNNQVILPKYINSYQQINTFDNKTPLFLANTLESTNQRVDDIYGLINVTCDQFTNHGGVALCHKGDWTQPGSYINNVGDSISYKFNGTRIHVVSFDQNNNNCGAKIHFYIDGVFKKELILTSKTGQFLIVYSSDYLPFGEHTIEIKHVANQGKSLFVNSFILDPLPSVGGHVLGFDDAKEKTDWTLDSSSNTPFIKSNTNGASLIFKFHGTRFWLTGIRDDSYGKCHLTIDEGDPITIDGRKGIDNFTSNYKVRGNGNKGILLYESNVLEFKDHTIEIKKIDNKVFCLINLLYSTQPYNAIVVPKEEITIDEHWTTEPQGYLTTYNGARASMNGYFNELWIIGNKTPKQQALMNVYYNEENIKNIDSISTEFTDEILFKNINNLLRYQYNIEIEKIGSSTEITSESLYISYLYYLNEKTINVADQSNVITTSDLETNKEGTWELKDGNLYIEERSTSISA